MCRQAFHPRFGFWLLVLSAALYLVPTWAKSKNPTLPIFRDSDSALTFLEQNNIAQSVAILKLAKPENFGATNAERNENARRILNYILAVQRNAPTNLNTREFWQSLWDTLQLVHQLEPLLQQILELESYLAFLETYHRFLENEFLSKPKEALAFLQEQSQNFDAIWLRVRIQQILQMHNNKFRVEVSPGKNFSSWSQLHTILNARLSAYLAEDDFTRKAALENLCNVLSSQGLALSIDLSEPEAAQRFDTALVSGPKCISLYFSQAGHENFLRLNSEEHLQIAFDTVVQAHGINLSIKAPDIDGGFFDLSVPEDEMFSSTLAGGSLTIDVRHSERSVIPVFVSLGYTKPEISANESNSSTRINGLLVYLVNGEIRAL